MDTQDTRRSAEHFLALIKASHRGKFKVYIGMSAGVGKTYRMLQEAHQLLDAGVDVQIGYIETHGRPETEALTEGLPFIPRRKLFYKGKELEEMDMQAIINLHPDIVVVDELAHTNIEGSANPKRWQDVMQLLDAGISVITAVNIQHIEGLNESVQEITGIEVRERVPDSVLATADEVVNIDLTADELIERLKAGENSILAKKFKSEGDVSLNDIINAVNREDLLCIELVEGIGQVLGRWLAGMINIFNPEKVVIGGNLSMTGDYILQPIKTLVRRYSLNLVNEDTKIVLSQLGDQVGLIGACANARIRAFDNQ